MSTRDQAIACITEKLRELAGIETALHANHARATKVIGNMSQQAYFDHREAAELHYVTADYYELLIEAITAIPLFDKLDAQFPRESEREHAAEVKYVAGITTSPLSETPLAVAFGAAVPDDGGALNGGRDVAEEQWQRDEAEREGAAELAEETAFESALDDGTRVLFRQEGPGEFVAEAVIDKSAGGAL